jgi:hypothetical protein
MIIRICPLTPWIADKQIRDRADISPNKTKVIRGQAPDIYEPVITHWMRRGLSIEDDAENPNYDGDDKREKGGFGLVDAIVAACFVFGQPVRAVT